MIELKIGDIVKFKSGFTGRAFEVMAFRGLNKWEVGVRDIRYNNGTSWWLTNAFEQAKETHPEYWL